MGQVVSLRGYAKHRGCSLRAVQKAIESGRIAKAASRDEATGKLRGVDADLADQLWARNTNPVEAAKSGQVNQYKPPRAASFGNAAGASVSAADPQLAQQTTEGQQFPLVGASGMDTSSAVSGAELVGANTEAATGTSAGPAAPGSSSEYFEHRAKREKFLAEQAELDYRQKIGALVPADEVERAQMDIWRRVRDAILKAFDQADSTLATIPQAAPVRGQLRAELRATLDELSESLALESEGAPERAEAML